MIPEFKLLTENEIQVMIKSPLYVIILIAGADGKIDKIERKEAIEAIQHKQNRSREQLTSFYKLVGQNFEKKFDQLLNELPSGTDVRIKVISIELKKLNRILPKLDKNFAIKYHASLKDLAKKVAEASGGVLGYLSISHEEAQLLDLKMIKNIA